MRNRLSSLDCTNYVAAVYSAHKLLADSGISALPVNVPAVCNYAGVRVSTYAMAQSVVELLGLHDVCAANDGITVMSDRLPYPLILVGDELDSTYRRFVIAHELAHYCLRHSVSDIGSSSHPDVFEHAADAFALSLLCPIGVVSPLGIMSSYELSFLCRTPLECAEYMLWNMRSYSWVSLLNKYTSMSLLLQGHFSNFIDNYKN